MTRITRRVACVQAGSLLSCFLPSVCSAQSLQKVTINFPSRTGSTWPLYVAKEGGYFEKYGIDANIAFAVHPAGIAMVVSGEAAMTVYTLEQTMLAAARDGSMVILGSPYRKSLFALMGGKGISSVKQLKGKRMGVSQLGDAPYNYAVGLLQKFGMNKKDVEWIPVGSDVNGRAAALLSGRVDASMITAPVYFKLEAQGYKQLANTSDYDDLFAPTVYVFKKTFAATNPKIVEALIKAHIEAIKRLYEDKEFSVKTYIKYNPTEIPEEVGRVWDRYTSTNTYDRVPYVTKAAVQYMLDHPVDDQAGAIMRAYDYRKVIDNTLMDRFVKEGFFEKLWGAGIRKEQETQDRNAFR